MSPDYRLEHPVDDPDDDEDDEDDDDFDEADDDEDDDGDEEEVETWQVLGGTCCAKRHSLLDFPDSTCLD